MNIIALFMLLFSSLFAFAAPHNDNPTAVLVQFELNKTSARDLFLKGLLGDTTEKSLSKFYSLNQGFYEECSRYTVCSGFQLDFHNKSGDHLYALIPGNGTWWILTVCQRGAIQCSEPMTYATWKTQQDTTKTAEELQSEINDRLEILGSYVLSCAVDRCHRRKDTELSYEISSCHNVYDESASLGLPGLVRQCILDAQHFSDQMDGSCVVGDINDQMGQDVGSFECSSIMNNDSTLQGLRKALSSLQ